MDFITNLASTLGVPKSAAEAVAGTVMNTVVSNTSDKLGTSTTQQLTSAIPELSGWQKAASALGVGAAPAAPAASTGGMGSLLGGLAAAGGGGLLTELAGAVGGQQARDVANLVAVFQKLGLDTSKAAMVAPMALDFLKSRLSPELVSQILGAVPMFTGMIGGAPAPEAPAENPTASVLSGIGKLFG